MPKLTKFTCLLFGFLFSSGLFLLVTSSAAENMRREKPLSISGYGESGYSDLRDFASANGLTSPDLGRSTYDNDGTDGFTGEDRSIMRFERLDVRDDGRVCIGLFQRQTQRCQTFLRGNGLNFLLNKEGARLPVVFTLEGN